MVLSRVWLWNFITGSTKHVNEQGHGFESHNQYTQSAIVDTSRELISSTFLPSFCKGMVLLLGIQHTRVFGVLVVWSISRVGNGFVGEIERVIFSKRLVKLTPISQFHQNFTSSFFPVFFCQKSNCKYRKAARLTLSYRKAARKMFPSYLQMLAIVMRSKIVYLLLFGRIIRRTDNLTLNTLVLMHMRGKCIG